MWRLSRRGGDPAHVRRIQRVTDAWLASFAGGGLPRGGRSTSFDREGAVRLGAVDGGSRPLHRQLRGWLRAEIEAGTWGAGDSLPTELEMCARFGVSRATVRKAVAALVYAGMVERHPGRGTFVVEATPPHAVGALQEIANDLRLAGVRATIRVLSSEPATAPEDVCESFGLAAGTAVWSVEQLLCAGKERVGRARHWFAPTLGISEPATAAPNEHPLAVVAGRGFAGERATQFLRAAGADAETAARLRVGRDTPVLLLTRVVMAHAGQPVLFTRAAFRGDYYPYRVLLRSESGEA